MDQADITGGNRVIECDAGSLTFIANEHCSLPALGLQPRHRQRQPALVQYGWEIGQATPKTDESAATVALDEGTALALAERLHQREAERIAAGDAWVETGLVFTEPDGSPLHPAEVTEEFQRLAAEAGLPPIRLHDLRHGAAGWT